MAGGICERAHSFSWGSLGSSRRSGALSQLPAIYHHSYNIWCVFQIYCKQNIMGPEPQPSLVCRLALLTYLPVVYRCSINERRPPVSSVVRNIIKLAYFILLAPQMVYNLINIQWIPILYLSRVYHHVNWLFISATANHRLWPLKASFYSYVIGRAADDVLKVRTNSIRKLQIYAYIIHFMSYK